LTGAKGESLDFLARGKGKKLRRFETRAFSESKKEGRKGRISYKGTGSKKEGTAEIGISATTPGAKKFDNKVVTGKKGLRNFKTADEGI